MQALFVFGIIAAIIVGGVEMTMRSKISKIKENCLKTDSYEKCSCMEDILYTDRYNLYFNKVLDNAAKIEYEYSRTASELIKKLSICYQQ